MERTRIWTLLSVVVLAGCAVSSERDEVGIAEQGLTAKVKTAWTRQFGTTYSERVWAVTTLGGYVYVTGRTNGELVLSGQVGQTDAFLRKLDANGTIVWTRQFGGDEVDDSLAIVADATGVYVGGFLGDAPRYGFVRKFDHDGNTLWTNVVAPDVGGVNGLAVDATGLYVVGSTTGALTGKTNLGGSDAFVAKYELGGDGAIWTQQFGTSADDYANAVFVDATGVYVAGLTGGVLGGANLGGQDAFLSKYDLNGNPIPNLPPLQFGTATSDNPSAITGDAGGIYVGGVTYKVGLGDPTDGFLRKFDRNLVELWQRTIAAGTQTTVRGLAVDDSGVLVAGFTNGAFTGLENKGGRDLFVRKLDRRGKDVWAFQNGTGAGDEANSLAINGSAVYVGGATAGALGAPNAGEDDALVFKLVPNAPSPTGRK